MSARTLVGLCLLTVALSAGCATGSTSESSPKKATGQTANTFGEPGIYATDSGRQITEQQLLDQLADHTYAVVGESHGVEWHHRIQHTIYRGLIERHRSSVALGMEMFQRPYQPALSSYIAGEIDESTMLERTEYDQRWGVAPRYYRPLWELARKHSAPLIALNARAELTRAVAKQGVDQLPSALKQDLPDDLTLYDSQRTFLKGVFGAHHPSDRSHGSGGDGQADSQGFQRFAMAQVVWDATMAQTARRFMRGDDAPKSMLIVCGRAHAHKGFGIPPRLTPPDSSSAPSPKQKTVATVLPVTTDQVARATSGSSMATLNSPEAADFLWVRDTQSN
jgi:uncharacterized iron-regulated protein